MSDFLTAITPPALNSATFAADIYEAFQNIDDNFKKIVSAPYLEGQEGNSVEAHDMHIIETDPETNLPITDPETNLPILTPFGLGMMRTIFENNYITDLSFIDQIAHPIGGRHAYDLLIEKPTTKVFMSVDPDIDSVYINENANTNWICSAEYYYFVDKRIEGIDSSQNPSSNETFKDYSCLVFAEWNGSGWVFTKGNMIPTIYYNSEVSRFCWCVNGIETGIFAQGIPGPAGQPPVSALVRGSGIRHSVSGETYMSISCNQYLSIPLDITQGAPFWDDIQNSEEITNGDLVVCIFDYHDDYGSDCPDMVIANITVTGNDNVRSFDITVPDSARMSSLWTSYILFHAFRDIDYKSQTGNKTKAIFIPTKPVEISSDQKDYAHAIFQDDSDLVFNGDELDYDQNTDNRDLVFRKVLMKKLVGSGSIGPNSIMSKDESYDVISDAKFEKYNVKARVSGVENVYLGTPIGSIVTWTDIANVPENWVPTGNTTTQYPPVFMIDFNGVGNDDYDVKFERAGYVITGGYGQIKDIRNGSTARNSDLLNIFSIVSGHPIVNGKVTVPTTSTSITNLLNQNPEDVGQDINWDRFDLETQIDLLGKNIKFYLTKYIGS